MSYDDDLPFEPYREYDPNRDDDPDNERRDRRPTGCVLPLFTATDDTLPVMIERASWRLLILAPGFSMPLARAICQKIAQLPPSAVTITIDIDPHVCRLGYGDVEAIEMLERVLGESGNMLHHHRGIRMGVIIADDQVITYAPTPLLVEKQLTERDYDSTHVTNIRPNAMLFGFPSQRLLDVMGQGPRGERDQTVGLDKVAKAEIQEVKQELEQSPPQRFDISRAMTVFNAEFEFVELKVKGVKLDRKSIGLPPCVFGIHEVEIAENLATRFDILPESDVQLAKPVREKAAEIRKQLLHTIPNFGTIILRRDKPKFLEEIAELRMQVIELRKALVQRMCDRFDGLRESLRQQALASIAGQTLVPAFWDWQAKHGTHRTREQFVDSILNEKLTSPGDLIGTMSVSWEFRGVTWETLTDPVFQSSLEKALPKEQSLARIFEAAPAQKPADRCDTQDQREHSA